MKPLALEPGPAPTEQEEPECAEPCAEKAAKPQRALRASAAQSALRQKAFLLAQLVKGSRADEKAQSESGKQEAGQSPAALDVARPLRKSAPVVKAAVPGDSYAPGAFQEAMKRFIQKRKADGQKHREAVAAWMCSNERVEYLATLSDKQMKRRRFN